MKTPRLYSAITALLILISLVLIFRSSQRMSLTIDESNHYHCGLEWWQQGTYQAWPENPVLSRIIPAFGAYVQGFRAENFTLADPESASVFGHFLNSYRLDYFRAGGIDSQLLWIRLPVMIMFLLSVLLVWKWTRELADEWCALVACGFYAFTPVMMAHAGLANTDVTFNATFLFLMWAFFRWINRASLLNGLWFGLGLAATLLTKFSVLPFFGLAMPVAFFLKWYIDREEGFLPTVAWIKGWVPSGLLATGVMCMLIWAFHGFDVGPIGGQPIIQTMVVQERLSPEIATMVVPAPEWFAGLLLLIEHNEMGMTAYMFGEITRDGFWYFYPVGITLKTPVAALLMGLLGLAGIFLLPRKQLRWEVAATFFIPFALMLAAMTSNINIGVRHMMVVYPLFAIGAAISTVSWLRTWNPKRKLALYVPASLLVLQFLTAVWTFPNYLNYFNILAGADPGNVMADSDLDWGQGIKELSEFAYENQIDTLHISYFGWIDECMYGLPPLKLLPRDSVVNGWVAVSENHYRGLFFADTTGWNATSKCRELSFTPQGRGNAPHTAYRWLDAYELRARPTRSIRVYYVSPETALKNPADFNLVDR